jgi:hypothetical protein
LHETLLPSPDPLPPPYQKRMWAHRRKFFYVYIFALYFFTSTGHWREAYWRNKTQNRLQGEKAECYLPLLLVRDWAIRYQLLAAGSPRIWISNKFLSSAPKNRFFNLEWWRLFKFWRKNFPAAKRGKCTYSTCTMYMHSTLVHVHEHVFEDVHDRLHEHLHVLWMNMGHGHGHWYQLQHQYDNYCSRFVATIRNPKQTKPGNFEELNSFSRSSLFLLLSLNIYKYFFLYIHMYLSLSLYI